MNARGIPPHDPQLKRVNDLADELLAAALVFAEAQRADGNEALQALQTSIMALCNRSKLGNSSAFTALGAAAGSMAAQHSDPGAMMTIHREQFEISFAEVVALIMSGNAPPPEKKR